MPWPPAAGTQGRRRKRSLYASAFMRRAHPTCQLLHEQGSPRIRSCSSTDTLRCRAGMTPEEEEFFAVEEAQMKMQTAVGGFEKWCELYMTRHFKIPLGSGGDLVRPLL